MRGLTEKFMSDLKDETGLLFPILERVRKDDTLMLAIRDGYINIYYRGGNLIRVDAQKSGAYRAIFDEKYNLSGRALPERPAAIRGQGDSTAWVDAFPRLKESMDLFFSKHPKAEREFQQLVARENNNSPISNETEYFIVDIELADSSLGARVDMLGVQWLAGKRNSGASCRPVLVEMKYGDNALDESSGLLKHLRDIEQLTKDKPKYGELLRSMELQFDQMDQLKLLNYNRCKSVTKIDLAEKKPEVILLLANHNPRSTKLSSLLNDPEIAAYANHELFDLRFYVSSFAGYGLHGVSMLSMSDFFRVTETTTLLRCVLGCR